MIVSVIVLLTKFKLKVKIVDGDKSTYMYPGSSVIFLSEFWHTSLSADNGTWKIVLFYKGNGNLRIDLKK